MGTINTLLKQKKINFLKGNKIFIVLFSLFFLAASCGDDPIPYTPTPYNLQIPSFFPTNLNIPSDNPLTVEGIELGRHLFYEPRLCGYLGTNPDSMMSCGTCHIQANNFKVGLDNPRFPNGRTYGLSGVYTPHNMMPLVNVVFNHEGYFWNGYIHPSNNNPNHRTLEDIVTMGITAPHEMNSSVEKAIAALKTVAKYPNLFEKAFGTPEITIDRVEKAIAQFVRTLVSGNSKFDRYMKGLETLTSSELNGYILFTTEEGADCFHCHGGNGTPLFTTNLFYNNALSSVFDDPRDRFGVTGNVIDRGAYRAPTLRNIAVSAPYMHDGRFSTLDQVLEFYNSGLVYSPYVSPLMHKLDQGGMLLTPSQIADLKAFLLTLTDHQFLTNPKFSDPN